MTLDELGVKYGTDKSSIAHGYLDIYETYFEGKRFNDIDLLEIGIKEGASLRMWKEYFQSGEIYGIDTNSSCLQYSDNRINIEIGDQSDDRFLNNLFIDNVKEFDIIIDDGGHYPQHQIKSFNTLFHRLKCGGLYIIEDLHTSKEYGPECINYFKDRINDVQLNDKTNDGWMGGNKNRQCNNMTYFEKYIKSIHFYKSFLIVIKDKD